MAQQSYLTQNPTTAFGIQDPLTISSTQKLPLGAKARLADGRAFVYGKAGASDLAYGLMAMQAAPSANANDEVVAASAAVGDTSISVTFGGAVTANQYAGGYLWVNDDTGEGQVYTVTKHAAGTTGVTVYLGEAIRVAVTAGSGTVSAIVHPCQDLIIGAATAGAPVGVPLVTVTAAYYAWFQVSGPAPVLTSGTVVIGNPVILAASGAVAPNTETTFIAHVGTVLSVNATTEYSLINLAIPGF